MELLSRYCVRYLLIIHPCNFFAFVNTASVTQEMVVSRNFDSTFKKLTQDFGEVGVILLPV